MFTTFGTIAATVVLGQATPIIAPLAAEISVEPKIISISMFKNGYAFVTREIVFAQGKEAMFVNAPQASLGTLWFWTEGNDRLESVERALEMDSKKRFIPYEQMGQILSKNLGKTVSLLIHSADGKESTVTGKILQSGTNFVTILEGDRTRLFNTNLIRSVSTADKDFEVGESVNIVSSKITYRVKKDKDKGRVMMMSLEPGFNWAPAYALELDGKNLNLVAKATLVNDGEKIENANVRLITGFPNLEFKNILDPFTANMSSDQWMNTLSGQGGSGMSRTGDMMNQQAAAPMSSQPNWNVPELDPSQGEVLGDLFFYDLKQLTLKKSSRLYTNLFKVKSEFTHLYRWNIGDFTVNNVDYQRNVAADIKGSDIWHSVQFKNNSGVPLTTAPATIFEKGQIIGQSLLNYVPAGSSSEVRVNKILDLKGEGFEEEVSRERGVIKTSTGTFLYDEVILKGTLKVANYRKEGATLHVQKELTGEVTSTSEGAVVTKTAKGLVQVNPTARIEWKPQIEPGKEKILTYTYKLFVRSQG